MELTPQEAAKRGLKFISYLVSTYSGQAVADLIEAGAPPITAAEDLVLANQVLQGCNQGATSDDEKKPETKENPKVKRRATGKRG